MLVANGKFVPGLSIVVPVYNEEHVLEEFYRRLNCVLETLAEICEIVFVDDGSSDGSPAILHRIQCSDPRVRVLRLSHNRGQHIALIAGLDHARGAVVAMLDADLQDSPAHIPTLLARLPEGYDLVFATRERRVDHFLRRQCASVFWLMVNSLTRVHIVPNQATLRVMSRQYLDALLQHRPDRPFLLGLMAQVGFRQLAVPVRHCARLAGTSKYNSWRLARLALDGIFALSPLPMRRVAICGGVLCSMSIAAFLALWSWTADSAYAVFVLWPAGLLFFGGLLLLAFGMAGVMTQNMPEKSGSRPMYIVEEDSRLGEVTRRD